MGKGHEWETHLRRNIDENYTHGKCSSAFIICNVI